MYNIVMSHEVDPLLKPLKKHFHSEYSITIIFRGKSIACIEGEELLLSSGDMLLLPREVVHSCIPEQDNELAFGVVLLDQNWMKCFFDDQFVYDCFTGLPFQVIKNSVSGLSVVADMNELSVKNFCISDYAVAALLTSISEKVYSGPCLTRKTDRKGLSDVIEFLYSCYTEPITLDQLAAVAGLSKYYLIQKFKKEYGLTPHAYLLNMRINAAKLMLQKGRSIIDTAFDLGFYDQSHFTNVFTQFVGIPPLAYIDANTI